MSLLLNSVQENNGELSPHSNITQQRETGNDYTSVEANTKPRILQRREILNCAKWGKFITVHRGLIE
jgi:hypothetical protein